jgi:hypothetical protein
VPCALASPDHVTDPGGGVVEAQTWRRGSKAAAMKA